MAVGESRPGTAETDLERAEFGQLVITNCGLPDFIGRSGEKRLVLIASVQRLVASLVLRFFPSPNLERPFSEVQDNFRFGRLPKNPPGWLFSGGFLVQESFDGRSRKRNTRFG